MVETNSKRITVKLGQIATKDFISTTITQQRVRLLSLLVLNWSIANLQFQRCEGQF